MGKAVTIQDKEYLEWIKDLGTRFRRSQIKAAVKVNEEMLRFYWELGHDIVERDAENHYGSRFFSILSHDLKEATSTTSGLSERNIRYAKDFYLLYSQEVGILQQPAAKSNLVDVTKDEEKLQQPAAKSNDTILPQLVEQIKSEIFSVPWGTTCCSLTNVKTLRKKHYSLSIRPCKTVGAATCCSTSLTPTSTNGRARR